MSLTGCGWVSVPILALPLSGSEIRLQTFPKGCVDQRLTSLPPAGSGDLVSLSMDDPPRVISFIRPSPSGSLAEWYSLAQRETWKATASCQEVSSCGHSVRHLDRAAEARVSWPTYPPSGPSLRSAAT
ncbi:hypothetical protein CISG_06705 [Coccidioides immitis RMSCC 3703]|uniref:Uncharacterized protein n=1 Tax=Coccidioides immitis RMSCC 3703 TaxID=454286 RepID=A0A0J8TVG3_COCIT|nr:hypothetical protein CISG_06705 [Coccidioides immitis RMSCC 3703]